MITFKQHIKEAKSNDSIVKRLENISGNLSKYKHRWGENPSARMYSWIDEYEKLKTANPEAWKEYCKKHGYSVHHDGYDNLA